MFYKVKDFVNANILESIYYALFESHINYACIIWGQNISTINSRIINFKERNAQSSPLFHYRAVDTGGSQWAPVIPPFFGAKSFFLRKIAKHFYL